MTRTLPLLVLAACGGPTTACEELDLKLVDECRQPVPAQVDDCDEGTLAACVSECSLLAECDVILATGDIDDPDYAARSEFFWLCVGGCQTS